MFIAKDIYGQKEKHSKAAYLHTIFIISLAQAKAHAKTLLNIHVCTTVIPVCILIETSGRNTPEFLFRKIYFVTKILFCLI